jgi:hypothetical protein
MALDIYTTAFTYPRRAKHGLHGKTLEQGGGQSLNMNGLGPEPDQLASPSDAEAVQALAMSVMNNTGCHVSYVLADQGRAWNFLVSGAYQQAMVGRGNIMRDCPVKVNQSSLRSISSTQIVPHYKY